LISAAIAQVTVTPEPDIGKGQLNNMKTIMAIALVACSLGFGGCCMTHHARAWEYKTVVDVSD
jgi:hypothetical protein